MMQSIERGILYEDSFLGVAVGALVFSHGVLTMEEGGMFWRERRARDSYTFKGYRIVGEGIRRAGDYPRAMVQAVDNIYRAIFQGDQLAGTGASALGAQRVCEQIKQQAATSP